MEFRAGVLGVVVAAVGAALGAWLLRAEAPARAAAERAAEPSFAGATEGALPAAPLAAVVTPDARAPRRSGPRALQPLDAIALDRVICRVQYEDDLGASGALVRVVREDTRERRSRRASAMTSTEDVEAFAVRVAETTDGLPAALGDEAQSFTADGAGVVQLPWPETTVEVTATALRGGVLHRGEARLDPRRVSSLVPFVVRVAPARELRVRVLDARGNPAAGVDLSATFARAPLWPGTAAITDDEGLAVVVAPPLPDVIHTYADIEVRELLPAPVRARARLSEDEELVLRLPPTGVVDLIVPRPAGRVGGLALDVVLVAEGLGAAIAPVVGELARFRHVGLGLELESHLLGLDAAGPAFAGPVLPDEVVEHRLARGQLAHFRVEVVDEHGQSLAEATLAAAHEFDDAVLEYAVRTDAEGCAVLEGRDDLHGRQMVLLSLPAEERIAGRRRVRVGQVFLRAERDSDDDERASAEPNAPPLYDAGRVTMALAPVVAAGHAVDTEGAPLARVRLAVGPPGPHRIAMFTALTGEDGGFLVQGPGGGQGQLALWPTDERFAIAAPLLFAAGSADLWVELRSVAAFVLPVRVTEAQEAYGLEVELTTLDGVARRLRANVAERDAGPHEVVECLFEARELPPGPATLTVRSEGAGELARVEVVLTAGRVTRLAPLDLLPDAERVRLLAVTGADGAPLPYSVRFVVGGEPTEALHGVVHGLDLVAPSPDARLEVGAAGHVPQVIETRGELRVELRAAPRLTLRIPDDFPWPAAAAELVLRRAGYGDPVEEPWRELVAGERAFEVPVGAAGVLALYLVAPGAFPIRAPVARVEVWSAALIAGAPLPAEFDRAAWTESVAALNVR